MEGKIMLISMKNYIINGIIHRVTGVKYTFLMTYFIRLLCLNITFFHRLQKNNSLKSGTQ